MCFMPQMLKRRLGTREVHNCFYGQSNCCSLQLRCSLMIRCRTIKGSFGAYFQNRLINLLEANLWEREKFPALLLGGLFVGFSIRGGEMSKSDQIRGVRARCVKVSGLDGFNEVRFLSWMTNEHNEPS